MARSNEPIRKAKIDDTPTGKQPADGGWWILNLEEIGWSTLPGGGTWCMFDARSPLLGIGVHILGPGETPGMYHAENNQEGFLVLSGDCLAIVEGEERRMRAWDYLHCPPGTAHITIGAGDGPCAILMVGTRRPDEVIDYLPEPAAQKYGAAVDELTHEPRVAYAGRPPRTEVRSPWPL